MSSSAVMSKPSTRAGQVERVGFVVEQPGVLAVAEPGRETGGEVARLRPPPAAEQFAEIAKAPPGRVLIEIGGIDRAGDDRFVLGAERLAGRQRQLRDQRMQESAVGRRVGQAQAD